MILYGVFRFFIEFLRGDDRGALLNIMSPSQFWSIVMVGAGVAVYFMLEFFYQKRDLELQFMGKKPKADAEKIEGESAEHTEA